MEVLHILSTGSSADDLILIENLGDATHGNSRNLKHWKFCRWSDLERKSWCLQTVCPFSITCSDRWVKEGWGGMVLVNSRKIQERTLEISVEAGCETWVCQFDSETMIIIIMHSTSMAMSLTWLSSKHFARKGKLAVKHEFVSFDIALVRRNVHNVT